MSRGCHCSCGICALFAQERPPGHIGATIAGAFVSSNCESGLALPYSAAPPWISDVPCNGPNTP